MESSQPNSSKKPSRLGRVISLIATLALLVGCVVAVQQRQFIVDFIRYHQYTPSQQVAALSTGSAMNQRGQFLFYASQPVVDGTQNFNNDCGQHEKSSAVLGCYADEKIYLSDVTNKELAGIEEVTAAHEMLHAAYQRLSSSERAKVDALLSAKNDELMKDKTYADRLAVYGTLPHDEMMNELHSIIGTEVVSVGGDLEQYYSQYFSNRSAVTELYQKYSTVFMKLQAHGAALAAELDQLATTINQATATYNTSAATLSQDITTFNTRASSGYYSSQSTFKADRSQLLARQQALQTQATAINANIATYNSKKAELDALNLHLTILNNSIDSSLAPAPAVQ